MDMNSKHVDTYYFLVSRQKAWGRIGQVKGGAIISSSFFPFLLSLFHS